MNKQHLIIAILTVFALIISCSTASADMWVSDASIISGLSDVGAYSDPAIFNDSGTWKLISGNGIGTWTGWYWSGSTWVSDASIVSGLTDVGDHSSPAIFNDSGTWKLISGNWGGTFTGWYWSGSTWVSDASIISGLSGVGRTSKPTVFLDGSTWKLISGQGTSFVYTNTLNGWYWSGSTWVSNASIVSGTSDSVQFSSPSVFTDDDTLKLISGDYWGNFKGWYWDGSAWVSDASIVSGLTDVGWRSTLDVYIDGSDLKVIVGDDSGLFNGWNELHLYKVSGYVTNNYNNSVSAATITLSNSGGSTSSNDTGYYEITGISSGTYTITATSPTHEDYSDTISITSNTEKNITMTRLNPVLTYTDADTTENDVILKWRRNIVVDNVRIYKDTETRLLTTVGSGSYLSGMYSDKNLDCNKGYVYWLQPMDGDVTGPKYRVDAKTDPCTGGGGGGTDPDPTPDPSPTVTPGPTVPPEINMTQEEWLNLTLEQKQEILTNISLFPPLLEFKWQDIYVWGIHLFLILCGIITLDSITTQKISEYTGLWAILPGVMFAYLSGYLVI